MIKKNQVVGRIEGELIPATATAKSIASSEESSSYSLGFSKPLPKTYESDIVIVGGGPGGYVAAIRAAQGGKKYY